MDLFWVIVTGLFVLGLMVLVHEWGHFIVARLMGVRVETFSIGFGPRLFGLRRGPTDYRVSALPLGGYVKMAGDNPLAERTGAPDEFLSRPRWQRFFIILAGPATNILLAVLLLAGVYAVRYERPAYVDEPARLHGVVADSPAARAGLQAGDIVVEINGEANPTWQEVQVRTLLGGKGPLSVTIVRGEERFTRLLEPELKGDREAAFVGWYPYDPIVIKEVDPEMPAADAGLKEGDEIVALDGEATSELGSRGFVERVQESEGTPLQLTVRRDGRSLDLTVAAEERTWRGQTGYFLGVGIGRRTHLVPLGLAAALQQSVADNLRFTGWLFAFMQGLFTGHVSMRSLEGPIGITVLSGQAAQVGWSTLLNLMAIISINLGVLNLLPIPILDGGHIALLGVEGLRRRDLSLQFKERATQIGFMILLLIFVVVMYNDLARYLFR